MVSHLRLHTPGLKSAWLTLSEQDTEALTRYGKCVALKEAGQSIFYQSQEAKKFYLLTSGIVRVSRILPEGVRHVVAFHWPGDLFGMADEAGCYLNQAETITPCMLYEFSAENLHEFLLSHPQIQQTLLIKAVHSLRATQRQLIVVGRLDVVRALAAFLLDCMAHEKYFNNVQSSLTLPMARSDIADYLGTAVESVTRAMGKLEAEGCIRRSSPRELILNLPKLKDLANID